MDKIQKKGVLHNWNLPTLKRLVVAIVVVVVNDVLVLAVVHLFWLYTAMLTKLDALVELLARRHLSVKIAV